eukprot:10906837-Alexandrium_andersonii.AAC.1
MHCPRASGASFEVVSGAGQFKLRRLKPFGILGRASSPAISVWSPIDVLLPALVQGSGLIYAHGVYFM